MTEVREIFDELLAGPVPPMPSSEVMLATARQAERRRRRGVLAAAAGGLALLAVAVPVGLGAAGTGPGPVVGGTPSPAVTPAPAGAVRTATDLLDALAVTLPGGYTIRSVPSGDDVRTDEVPDVDRLRPGMGLAGVRRLDATAVVYVGAGAGELAVSLVDGRAAADPVRRTAQPRPGDLCTEQNSPGGARPGGTQVRNGTCRTLLVGDVPVRITTTGGGEPEPVDCLTASRFAPGVEVSLRWCPAVTSFTLAEPPAPVGAAVLTDERLAELAAAPAFLPAPLGGGR